MNSRSETLAALVAGCPHVEEVFVRGSWVRPSSVGRTVSSCRQGGRLS
jgi:hypothetical protein